MWLLGGFEWRYGWEVTARWRNIGRFSLRVDAKVPGDLGEGYGFCNFADRLKPLGKQMGIWGGAVENVHYVVAVPSQIHYDTNKQKNGSLRQLNNIMYNFKGNHFRWYVVDRYGSEEPLAIS